MEFLKNLINPVTERVRSPFYGAFAISWLLVNWRILLAVFSSNDIIENESKFNFISKQLFEYDKSIVFPLVFTFVYLMVLPWVDYLVFWYSEFAKNIKYKRKVLLGKNYTVSGEKYYKLWEQYKKERDSLGKALSEIEGKDKEILEKDSTIRTLAMQLGQNGDTIREKDTVIDKYRDRQRLGNIFVGQWRKGYRFTKKQEFEKRLFVFDQSSSTFQEENDAGGLTPFEIIDFVDIDPEKNRIKFLIIEGSKTDIKIIRTELSLDKEENEYVRYKGQDIRWDGKVAEVFYEKVLK